MPAQNVGIEPYAELARSARAPGGWGAEESGAQSGPGLRQQSSVSQCSEAAGGPKFGGIMVPTNEYVNVATGLKQCESSRIVRLFDPPSGLLPLPAKRSIIVVKIQPGGAA
jgi:hypothetical protein